MESSSSDGLIETQYEKKQNRSWAYHIVSSLPYFGKRRKHVIGHIVPSLECQPLKSSDKEFPEQCEMLLQSPEQESKQRSKAHDKNTTAVVLAGLFICFTLSTTSVMWLTDFYDNSILKLVSIRNDVDLIYNLWRSPPTRPLLSVYIFNYTNHEKALKWSEKPKVSEVGPYVFRERMERINIRFNENNTVSFQENKTIEFLPELSNGSLNATVFVPNIPVLTVLKHARKLFFMSQRVLSALMGSLKAQPFQNVTVHDFIWGYDDDFYRLIRNLTIISQLDLPSKFGFLAKRRGVHHHVITMNTGLPNLDSVGEITRFDGMDRIGVWGNTNCDKLEGSDGSLFPGNKANRHVPLYIYSKDMCRRLPIYFNKTTKSADGFNVVQYNIPNNMFDYTNNTPENRCYKFDGEYPPNGVFYSGPCQNGAPIYASFPHFWQGVHTLHNNILGLSPDPEKHSSMFLIHERLGVCLLAKTRFQLNIKLEQPVFMWQFKGIQNGTIFPIAWLEYNSGALPDHFVNVVYHLTYTVRTVQHILKWTTLLCLLISLVIAYKQVIKYFYIK